MLLSARAFLFRLPSEAIIIESCPRRNAMNQNLVMHYFSLPLYIRTLIHIRPKQILYRGWYALRAHGYSLFKFSAKSLPNSLKWEPLKTNMSFISYPWFQAADIARKNFSFLNDQQRFPGEIDWQIETKNRLWRYNLHYFQYLHPKGGLEPKVAIPLIQEWIRNNPPGSRDAWDPFPISLRLVNWIKYLSRPELQMEESVEIIRSLYRQCLWLERSLEYHVLANHIFKNAKALFFCGLFFKGPDAERWLSRGADLMVHELDEQILLDGGHFERSPMYHSMILEDCLDLLNVCHVRGDARAKKVSKRIRAAARKMVNFLLGLTHPDGRIALFNDAAFGIEAQPADLVAYYEDVSFKRAPVPNGSTISFPDTGYYIISPADGNRMLIDCGPIGPEYQTGHSHCDTLSFELSLKGRRVVVDSGCFGYEDGPIREYNRGNAGHNTITIDGTNQSEVWGAFRCARRARTLYGRLNKRSDGTLLFEGAHDGYRRLSGGPVHHRRICWSNHTYLIEDRVEGRGRHKLESRLHIHPALGTDKSTTDFIITNNAAIIARISALKEQHIEKIDGWYCPEFGLKEKGVVLRTRSENESLPFVGGWQIKVED